MGKISITSKRGQRVQWPCKVIKMIRQLLGHMKATEKRVVLVPLQIKVECFLTLINRKICLPRLIKDRSRIRKDTLISISGVTAALVQVVD